MCADGTMSQWEDLGMVRRLSHSVIGILIVYLLFIFYKRHFLSFFFKSVKIPTWDLIFIFIILFDVGEHYNFSIFHSEFD